LCGESYVIGLFFSGRHTGTPEFLLEGLFSKTTCRMGQNGFPTEELTVVYGCLWQIYLKFMAVPNQLIPRVAPPTSTNRIYRCCMVENCYEWPQLGITEPCQNPRVA